MGSQSMQYWYPNNASNSIRGVRKDLEGLTEDSITVTDDDDAATAGTDVNIVPDGNGLARVWSICANSADTYVETANGAALVIKDSDAPGGVALYFDDDEAEGRRFNANLATWGGHDVFVPLSSGEGLRVVHKSTPTGAITHVDDDGGTASARLLFVGPNDADGTETTKALLFSGVR